MKAPDLSWYGIKTLYRIAPAGRRLGSDSAASSDATLVEERVVILRARNRRDAVRKAEAEAREYASDVRHRNPYGQRVRARYLGYCDAFDINEPVRTGTEVFSTTEVVSRRLSDRSIVKRQLGCWESERVYSLRRNILDIALSGPAAGVKLNSKERALVGKYHAALERMARRKRKDA
jgi:hypothetical protein